MPILVVQQNNTGKLTRTCMHPAQYDARGTRIMNAHMQCWALHVYGAGVMQASNVQSSLELLPTCQRDHMKQTLTSSTEGVAPYSPALQSAGAAVDVFGCRHNNCNQPDALAPIGQ